MGTIEIIPMGTDAPSFEETKAHFMEDYAPVVAHLLDLAESRDIVHTVPGGPLMADVVRHMVQDEIAKKYDAVVPGMPFDMTPIVDVMAALRGENGCPWDKAQTHKTLRRFLLEEVYEMLDAVDGDDMDGIREELGDVLYQVVIHARIAEEKGLFSAQDIVEDITKKMIRRHPHVFHKKSLENIGSSVLNWDRLKQGEQRQHHNQLLEGVIKGLPSLLQAYKLQEKAAKVGFEWDTTEEVFDKFNEEWQEFREAIIENDWNHMEEEAGDVLFVFANICRRLKLEPECALHRANSKFRRRFAYVEKQVQDSARSWEDYSLDELDAFWNQAKVLEHKDKETEHGCNH